MNSRRHDADNQRCHDGHCGSAETLHHHHRRRRRRRRYGVLMDTVVFDTTTLVSEFRLVIADPVADAVVKNVVGINETKQNQTEQTHTHTHTRHRNDERSEKIRNECSEKFAE